MSNINVRILFIKLTIELFNIQKKNMRIPLGTFYNLFFLYIFSAGSNVFNHDARSVSTEFKAPSVGGWMGGAGPPSMVTSGSGTGTLTKRSTSRNAMHLPPARQLSGPDALVKDYNKKRWLILALLSVEIETVVTTQHPLETTRENLQALLSNWLVSGFFSPNDTMEKVFYLGYFSISYLKT